MKKAAGVTLKFLGALWLGVAVIIIVVGYAGIAMKQGIGAMLEVMSPWNLWNFVALIVTVGPGLLMRAQGEKLVLRAKEQEALHNRSQG